MPLQRIFTIRCVQFIKNNPLITSCPVAFTDINSSLCNFCFEIVRLLFVKSFGQHIPIDCYPSWGILYTSKNVSCL